MKTGLFMILIGCGVCGAAQAAPAVPNSATPATTAERCEALAHTDLSDIPDAPSEIVSAKVIKGERNAPDYCEVRGDVAPQVGFEMRLPIAGWNGKFLEEGCLGHCGEAGMTIAFCPLQRGYACAASDAGHKGTMLDVGLWAYDSWQATLDWGYRAPHVTALAGKSIVERFYGTPPNKSYFIGVSTGGRQALQEAQRFPGDFDGIIAIAPPIDLSSVYMAIAWGWRVTHDEDGKALLGKAELKLLTDAALAKCDLDDGVKDGIISDPLHCAFDASVLACKSNQASGCLTSIQLDAVKKVYVGPTTASGVKLTLGGPLVGSEAGGMEGWGPTYDSELEIAFITGGLSHLFFLPDAGPQWKLSEFNFDRDSKRLATMESIYDARNPDLRQFKAAGGKLMILQGLDDTVVLPRSTIDYYETVERTMGGRAQTQSFARLFLVPGAEHVFSGVGAGMIDSLAALEAWIHDGKAPDRLIAAHLTDDSVTLPLDFSAFPLDVQRVQFTRPVFPYPIRAKYRGSGDPSNAANFVPITP